MMKEVVVKGNAPLHKMTTEGIQTNIENTILSKLGTCEDILAHVPGLTKKKDGKGGKTKCVNTIVGLT